MPPRTRPTDSQRQRSGRGSSPAEAVAMQSEDKFGRMQHPARFHLVSADGFDALGREEGPGVLVRDGQVVAGCGHGAEWRESCLICQSKLRECRQRKGRVLRDPAHIYRSIDLHSGGMQPRRDDRRRRRCIQSFAGWNARGRDAGTGFDARERLSLPRHINHPDAPGPAGKHNVEAMERGISIGARRPAPSECPRLAASI